MPIIIVQTYHSLAGQVRGHYKFPSTMSDDQVMSWHYHVLLKQPPENIVRVERSSLLSDCGQEIEGALRKLEHDAIRGDLAKYVSKEAKKPGRKHDELLYRSGIWHFHILPEPGKAIHTSKHLFFAYTWRKVLYLLAVGTHARGEFSRDMYYLELISKEWPDVLPQSELSTDLPPLGGGVEDSHESTLMFNYYQNMKRYAEHADKALRFAANQIEDFLASYGIRDIIFNLDFLGHDRAWRKGFNPSYAFYYRIRGTPFCLELDLRHGSCGMNFLTLKECTEILDRLSKGID